MIWNALDAEAMNVEVTIALGELGAPEEIVVRDDGHGMTYQQVPDMFLVHGESWKTGRRFSPNIDRPMHGQLGPGRFLNAMLDLTAEEQEVLSDLLERTKLASIVRAAQTVADRAEPIISPR